MGEGNQGMPAMDLPRRLSWLIAVRLLISTTLLGWAIAVQIRSPGVENRSFYLLIAATYLLSLVFGTTVRFASRHRWLIELQLASDVLIITAFIALTGGVNSYFASLYFLPIIAAGTLQLRRGGLVGALMAAIAYAAIVTAQHLDVATIPAWLRQPALALPPVQVTLYTVAINVFAFFAVGYLSGSLAEGIRSAGVRLERASTEIANLQALNEHVINSLTSGLATTDYNGRVLTFNRAAELITGHSAGTAIGQNVSEVLQLPPRLLPSLASTIDEDGARRFEFPYRTVAGATIDLGMNAAYLVTPGGPAGFLLNFQDVTTFKKLEREARMQHRLAAVGEMAAGIAHEIRNPLASMSGSIQILRKELPLTDEQGQLMDIVLRESERLNNIIRSFLAYARPQRFQVTRLDVCRVLRDAAVLLRNSSEATATHTIEVDVPPDELSYEADEGQIRQVVWNLATNGLRAMPDGGRLRLSAAAVPTPESAAGLADADTIITIADEGVGMSSDDLDHIFQPFHGSFAKGSGLGLAIVHRIVSDYHGEIQVTSKSGAGTSVRVRLPGRTAAALA